MEVGMIGVLVAVALIGAMVFPWDYRGWGWTR